MHVSALFCLFDQTFKKKETLNTEIQNNLIMGLYLLPTVNMRSIFSHWCLIFFPPTEMSPEQQRAVVHKRLSLVADEIFRILETLMGEYEAEVSGSHEEVERHRRLLDVTLKTEANLHRTGTFFILYSCHWFFSSTISFSFVI